MHRHLKPTAIAVALLSTFNTFAADETIAPEVVVTATRFSEIEADAPLGIQVISAEDIERSTATSVAEVLSKLAGVQTRVNLLGTPDSPVDLRGFGVTGDQNTLVLVNGVRISENELAAARISSVPLNSIDRIEILRGSGAVLYGAGATGGVINIITKSPTAQKLSGQLFGLVGSHDTNEVRGNIAVGGDAWGLSLGANRRDTDNYRKNNQATSENVNGELRFNGSAGWVALRVDGDRLDTRLPGSRSEAQFGSDPRGTSTPNDYFKSDGTRSVVSGEYRVGDLTFSADAGLRNKSTRFFSDFGFGFTSLSDTDTDTLTLSPRMKWRSRLFGKENVLIVGSDLADWDYRNNQRSSFGDRNENGRQTNRALYFHDQIKLTEAWRLSLGGRRENIKQSSQESLTPILRSEKTHHLNAHEIGLQYQATAKLSAFARTGRSYRIANIDENRCYFAPCPPMLAPQTSRDHEIGLEWTQKNGHLRGSFFESELNNEIYYNALTFSNTNLSPTRRRGIELLGQLAVTEDWDIGGSYSYTQAKFREGVYGGIDVSGKNVPVVPHHRANFNVGWQATATTRVTAGATYVGGQTYDNDPANRFREMPSYTLADLKLTQQVGTVKLAAGVNNLFDKKYYSYALINGAATTFNAYPEAERTAYISAEYAW